MVPSKYVYKLNRRMQCRHFCLLSSCSIIIATVGFPPNCAHRLSILVEIWVCLLVFVKQLIQYDFLSASYPVQLFTKSKSLLDQSATPINHTDFPWMSRVSASSCSVEDRLRDFVIKHPGRMSCPPTPDTGHLESLAWLEQEVSKSIIFNVRGTQIVPTG